MGPCSYDVIHGHGFVGQVQYHATFQNDTMTCLNNPISDNAHVDSHPFLIKESKHNAVSISDAIGTHRLHYSDHCIFFNTWNTYVMVLVGIFKGYSPLSNPFESI